jgi:hypothetical protein
MTKKPFVSPSFLKQKARQLKRQKTISQAQALDEAAKELGYSNYKNYLNASKANQNRPVHTEEALLLKLSSEKQTAVTAKVELFRSRISKLRQPTQELVRFLNETRPSENQTQSICDTKLELKEYMELHLLLDALEDEGGEIDSYAPNHLANKIFLSDLEYRMNEGKLIVEGNYDLKLKFAFDHDPTDKDDFFDDQEMFGSFELTIDGSGEITFENQDLGHYL